MAHFHSHDHGHHHGPQSINLAFGFSIVLNLAFAIVQIVYAFLSNSMSLSADAAHNFGDVFGLVLAWGANWMLALPARKRYSYGFKRTTILAAIANALILVGTSALIIYESINKLFHLNEINAGIVIIVALIGIFVNGGTALLFKNSAHDDLNIKGAFLHLVGDALTSLGVVVGGVLIYFTHKQWIDPIIALIIVTIILWSAWGMLQESVRLILDAIPHYIDYKGVKNYLENLSGVIAVHDLHIWGLSTKEIALTAHLVMPEKRLSDADYQEINNVLKEQFRINHVTLQTEKGDIEYPCHRSQTC
jgi:cobalt-zinc-cadmium efflux system protein